MLVRFKVSGVTFGNRQDVMRKLYKEGPIHKAALVREPNNPHDPNAVMVQVDGKHIGYVPKEASEDIGEIIPYIIRTNVELGRCPEPDSYFAQCTIVVPGGEA